MLIAFTISVPVGHSIDLLGSAIATANPVYASSPGVANFTAEEELVVTPDTTGLQVDSWSRILNSMFIFWNTPFPSNWWGLFDPFPYSPAPVTPTPTQAQVNSEIRYCMWLFPYQYLPWTGHYRESRDGFDGLGNEFVDPQCIIDNLEGMSIDTLIVAGGTWRSDGTIAYDRGTTVSVWRNFVAALKAWDPDMNILVWVMGWNVTDLSKPAIRQTMCNSAKDLLTAVPFDGWNEDYEGWTGDLVHLKSYYEEIAATVKGLGKIATVATEVEWGGYSIEDYGYILNTDFDCVMPMYYGHIVSDDGYLWTKILVNSPVPVVMGISVWDGVFDSDSGACKITFEQQLAKIDDWSKVNLAGYSIWCYDHMSYEEMVVWRNWVK